MTYSTSRQDMETELLRLILMRAYIILLILICLATNSNADPNDDSESTYTIGINAMLVLILFVPCICCLGIACSIYCNNWCKRDSQEDNYYDDRDAFALLDETMSSDTDEYDLIEIISSTPISQISDLKVEGMTD